MAPLMDVDDVADDQSTKNTSHDFTAAVGYTVPAADGANIDMNDLSMETPAFREVRQVKVHDVRSTQEKFTLDKHGFQYYKLPSIPGAGEVDFTNNDDPKIPQVHYKGMADWFAKQ